jgi:hypothetical protein
VSSGFNKKSVIVVSDSAILSRAIEINLHDLVRVRVVEWMGQGSSATAGPQEQEKQGKWLWDTASPVDLIVVGVDSPVSEPIILLAQTGLLEWVGQVPLLIVADGPSRSIPGIKIAQIDFPFEAWDLRRVVAGLLWVTEDPPVWIPARE